MTLTQERNSAAYNRGYHMGYINTKAIYDPPIRLMLPRDEQERHFNRGFRAGAAVARAEEIVNEKIPV